MMTQKELHKMARKFHVPHNGMSNTELIRKLQISEGNFDCYGKASEGVCDQSECLWRDDCMQVSAASAGCL